MQYERLRYLQQRREANGFINAPQRRRHTDDQVTAITGDSTRGENPNSGSHAINNSRCPTFEVVSDPRHLVAAFKTLRQYGGKAAGIDARTYDDFSTTEIGRILRTASQAIRRQAYRPERTKRVEIPRPSRGPRVLDIGTVVDRTISAGVAWPLSEYLDQFLEDNIYGFRPGRSPYHLLIELERLILVCGHYFISKKDIQDAFPSTSIGGCLNALQHHISDQGLIQHIATILRGNEGVNHRWGLRQGDATSPLAFNILMRSALDLPLIAAAEGNTQCLRFADDMAITGRSVLNVRRTVQTAQQLLARQGMGFKGTDSGNPVDLRRQGASLELLGVRARLQSDHIQYGLTTKAVQKLQLALQHAWNTPDPTDYARAVVRGWTAMLGPVVESEGADMVVTTAIREASQAEFREVGPLGDLHQHAGNAAERWRNLRINSERHQSATDATQAQENREVLARLGNPDAWHCPGGVPFDT